MKGCCAGMSEIITKKKIKDLRIWSDNPRYGYGSELMDESTAINTLIDVVGENKMYALAKDIVESNGLMGNSLPTIVEKDGEFLVYDGNRRISTIKYLLNPSVIESASFKGKIEKLVENKDLSYLLSINVLLTDEENALRIMDGTHTGERGGAGLIPWDAYNRDISLASRNKPVLYPISFSISKVLGLKRKKDFDIQYTDFQRLFSSTTLKAEFGINAFDDVDKQNIQAAVTALRAYKDFKKFQSYSREFNTTKDEADSNLPISRFISWHRQIAAQSALYSISFTSIDVFEGDEIPDVKANISVIKNDDNSVVEIDSNLLDISYENPAGKKCKDISNTFIGDWKCKIIYDGCSAEGVITIKRLEEPIVHFKDIVVQKGTSLALRSCVSSAVSSRRQSMVDSMNIGYNGDGNPVVYNGVLTGETEVGNYTFTFTFDNDGTPYSINHTVVVKPIPDIVPTAPSLPSSPFIDILRINPFVKLNEITDIIREINQAWQEGKHRLAVCGMRATLELTLDDVAASGTLAIHPSQDLASRLKDFVSGLLDATNGILRNITNAYSHLSFHNEVNFLTALEADKLVKALHLAAHKSTTYLNINSIFEACNKDLSHIICLAELVLR